MRADAARAEPLLEPLVRERVAHHALFAGVAVGFLACCVAGWIASGQSLYPNLVRPHQLISPEASFRPTVSQFRALVTATAPPDRVVVIVGGSSVFHGTGQGRDQVWTCRLQERLGEPFRVFNLAFRAGAYSEGGAIVAESLIKDGRPVIYVGDTRPIAAVPPLRGFHYEYVFWDAYEKGLLLDDPVREARLGELIGRLQGPGREALDERRLGARLDRHLRFNDLWTTVGYRWVFTIWNPISRDRPFVRRRALADPETGPSPPFDQRYLEAHLAHSLRIARGFAEGNIALDAQGRPVADPTLPRWRAYRHAVEVNLPRALRQRSLLVVTGQSPYYLDISPPRSAPCTISSSSGRWPSIARRATNPWRWAPTSRWMITTTGPT